MQVFYGDHHPVPLPDGHPFPIDKYVRLRQRLAAERVVPADRLHPAPPATPEQLLRVHDPDYVQRVAYGQLSPRELRRLGFPWSPELYRRSIHSVGGTIAAARAALDTGLGINLAGGTHHAGRAHGAGFCVFNDVMVAIRTLQADNRLRRAAVLDCDVHQGDGTAELAEGDDTVFTMSIHGANNFPVRKRRSDLDVALPNAADDETYLAALTPAVERALGSAAPELVFYLAGADPYAGDRFGRLAVTKAGLAARDRLVLGTCHRRGIATAVVMAGGYAADLDDIVDIQAETVRIAAELWHDAR
jgi:acetoin utilization deacetylase AcuC-like enzyme